MPEKDESFLEFIYRRIGSSRLGIPKEVAGDRKDGGTLFETERPQEAVRADKLDHLNLVLGGNKIRMELDDSEEGLGQDIREEVEETMDLREKDIKIDTRNHALEEALERFNEEEYYKARTKFKLGERVGQILMDSLDLDERRIGSEVSARIPFRGEDGEIVHKEEVGSRDLFMYGKDDEGNSKGISIEIHKDLEAEDANKFLYGLRNDFIVDNEDVSLSHNVILASKIGKDMRKYLNLARRKDGYIERRDEDGEVEPIKIKPSKEHLKDIDDEELEKMIESLGYRSFEDSDEILQSPEEYSRDELLESVIDRTSQDIRESLKKTTIGITDKSKRGVEQFIVFEEDGDEIRPSVIDRGEQRDVMSREKDKRKAEELEEEYTEEA